MFCQIRNEFLTVEVNTEGASLWSIKDNEGREYLWQGDPAYWTDRAPNLFPYIARLTQKKYTLMGKTYEMEIHGFAKRSDFSLADQGGDYVVLALEDNEVTRAQYPYSFRLEVRYELRGKTVAVSFSVANQNEETMYFGIGGHPGFFVPMEEGLVFEDYYLEFPQATGPKRVEMSKDCFVVGEGEEYPLEEGKRLRLTHDLFDDDAIIFSGMPKEITLKSDRGTKGVRVRYPRMNYLGVWHKPHTDAPYVCIEPWSSLPSRKDVIEELSKQENLVCLPPERVYENHWEIEIL